LKKYNSYLFGSILITWLLLLSFPRCANIVPPTGGPRDTIPPKVVGSTPENYSTRFTVTSIHIEFDEFIQLRNINQQFIITPPQKERPDFRVRGRNLNIDLNTELVANTTYTLNFGDAIVDLNEGNILRNYEFVFSTGDEIDSLSYSGIVLNAYDKTPAENVIVMLYEELHDSVPYRRLPLYANRTGKDGRFQLNNIRADTFKVFALADANNNYLYDRKGDEAIAFLDYHIFPETIWHEKIPGPDTIPADTINNMLSGEARIGLLPESGTGITKDQDVEEPEKIGIEEQKIEDHEMQEVGEPPEPDQDTLKIVCPEDEVHDTLAPADILPAESEFGFRSGDILFLFTEETGRQYISRNERNRKGELLFVFNRPLEKEWSIEPVNFEPPDNWKLTEKSHRNDSIRYWITDPETKEIERMRFLVTYWATGPSDSLRQISDTVNMNYTAPVTTRRQAQEEETPVMNIDFNIRAGGNQELNQNLKLRFPAPLLSFDLSKTALYTIQNNDTDSKAFEFIQDTLIIRSYGIITSWIPGQEYRFFAGPGAFTDIFGLESDSLFLDFTTRADDHYGSILLTLTGVTGNIILQLLDEKDNVLREYYPDEDGDLVIDYLQPQKFRLKAIFDTNNNKKWDTGNYLEGIQPERVTFYKEIIAIRSNWAIEMDWDLSMPEPSAESSSRQLP